MPGSPASITICPLPANASSKAAVSIPNSDWRPMNPDSRDLLFDNSTYPSLKLGTYYNESVSFCRIRWHHKKTAPTGSRGRL